MLNMFPLLWPGALAGAFILPRKQPPAPPPYIYAPYYLCPAQYPPGDSPYY
jgi:hypothetical protein